MNESLRTSEQDQHTFLERFRIPDSLFQLSVARVNPDGGKFALIDNWYEGTPEITGAQQDLHVFFAPAQRRTRGSLKGDVYGTIALWVDVDNANPDVIPDTTLPPSAVVWSGHGWHLYWRFNTPLRVARKIETYNKVLIADVPGADGACWNANRLMRVPGTWNPGDVSKDESPTECKIVHMRPLVYDWLDVEVLAAVDHRTRDLLTLVDKGDFPTRSERDYSCVAGLVTAGASDELIERIFTWSPIGGKMREHTDPHHYITTTIAKVREGIETALSEVGADPSSSRPLTANDIRLIGNLERNVRAQLNGGVDAGAGAVPAADSQGPVKAPRGAVEANANAEARKKLGRVQGAQIIAKDNGYWVVGHTTRQVSTFVLHPKMLLDGKQFKTDDALVCDITIDTGERWEDITLPRSAFNSVAALDKHLGNMLWVWLGTDADVRLLITHLTKEMRDESGALPRIEASSTIGLHKVGNDWIFLGDRQTLTTTTLYEGTSGSITWMPTRREHPKMELGGTWTDADKAMVAKHLPYLNDPCPMWILIGWYGATCMKPWLESRGYRFPILNATGTKGSGKTSLTQRVLMPLFGQPNATGYNAGTTPFVILSLLGSANAAPIAFSEFRVDSVEKFNRTILMAYDTGHDPRGKGDQTTVDYPLSAPFSIDGEDVINDPAARERIVVARLRPHTVAEGSQAYEHFNAFRENVPTGFGGSYTQACLNAISDDSADILLKGARAAMFTAFPSKLPDRVRNNYTVALFGAWMAARHLGITEPGAEILEESIRELVSLETGRSRTLVDDFAESVVNAMRGYGINSFGNKYESKENVLYVQISTAYTWWLQGRRRQGRSAMERDSISSQLREASYFVGTKIVDKMIMYGISLDRAAEAGLDIPTRLEPSIRLTIPSPVNN